MTRLPTPQEYMLAVQNPQVCFSSPQLKTGRIVKNKRGLPVSWAGQFAVVFRLETTQGSQAIRCFTGRAGRQNRYEKLHQHITQHSTTTLARFEYLTKGILVGANWWPIVEMEWIQGKQLDKRLGELVQDGNTNLINQLAEQWLQTVIDLRRVNMAHGDFQHENILVSNGKIRLVDYDGIYVPGLNGERAIELGHHHYQHPSRSANDYNEQMDNFSSAVIYLSLKALASDLTLWSNFHTDKHLILQKKDFEKPTISPVFVALSKSRDPIVHNLSLQLANACSSPVSSVPSLEVMLRNGQSDLKLGTGWKKTWGGGLEAPPPAQWKTTWGTPEVPVRPTPTSPQPNPTNQLPSSSNSWKNSPQPTATQPTAIRQPATTSIQPPSPPQPLAQPRTRNLLAKFILIPIRIDKKAIRG